MADQFHRVKKTLPVLGVGLGFREPIARDIFENSESIDFLELISEHYLNDGPTEAKQLEELRRFKLVSHGIELSIGNMAELDVDYLKKLNRFLNKIEAPWWSDHLCFTGIESNRLHDLLPLPFSMEAVMHVVSRIKLVREIIDRPLILENISSYIRAPGSELTEAQFIGEVAERADCGLLLDVNNVYVNAFNHNYDPIDFINQLPLERAVQVHIAGHKKIGSVIMDTHGAKVIKPVYDLLALTLEKTDVKAILLERDQLFPRFSSILSELDKIKRLAMEKQPLLSCSPIVPA